MTRSITHNHVVDQQIIMDGITKDLTFKQLLSKYALMIWDGVAFFGTNSGKLPRLRGQKIGCCDKYNNCQQMSILLITLVLMIVVVTTEYEQLGDIESQHISIERGFNLTYLIEKELPIMTTSFWSTSEL